ncbi:cytochrome P450 [Streptomyces noursei]|uniref:cytochrome P450 n=1 Tax=Streptomyces noursei TaxID=1971 RepID=UPI003558599B
MGPGSAGPPLRDRTAAAQGGRHRPARKPGHPRRSAPPGTDRRIITETLRLYPSAWFLTRTVTQDTHLGRHPLPAGTSVVYSPYLRAEPGDRDRGARRSRHDEKAVRRRGRRALRHLVHRGVRPVHRHGHLCRDGVL